MYLITKFINTIIIIMSKQYIKNKVKLRQQSLIGY